MSGFVQTTSADTPPPIAIIQIVTGFRVARATYIAAKLGLADLLKGGPKGIDELATATDTHGPSLYRIMRMLASVGMFTEDEQGRFALTPIAAILQTKVPGSMRAWATLQLGEENYQAWGDLMHCVRTGDKAFDHVFGMDAWQYRTQNQNPGHTKMFDEAMANLSGVFNAAVLASYPFSTIGKIVDVGGGDGSFMVALLQANPGMKGVLVDLPHVAEKAKKRIAETGLTDRCEVVAGDAFASMPSGGDAYILSRVIHDWDDDHAIAILTNCQRAMTNGGKLLLVEPVLPDRVEQSIAVQCSITFDLSMMVMTGGRERTVAEHRALFKAAGFELRRIIPTEYVMSVVEGTRS